MSVERKKYRIIIQRAISGVIALAICIIIPGFKEDKEEYTIKALFIYNFTKYIEWPEQELPPQFNIGVLGESAISEKLSVILKGKKIYNRTVQINELKGLEEISNQQIVFVTKGSSSKIKQILEKVGSGKILIVAEDVNMAAKGSGINIIEKNERMKFEMNEAAIKKSGLKVSGQLYDLAIQVK